jgi:predicted kinase
VTQRDDDVARILTSLQPLPPPSPAPVLVMLSGLPGSGKSTVARALVRRLAMAIVESDRVRKLLVDRPAYTPGENERVFGAIYTAVEHLLARGIPVILDATSLTARDRRPGAAVAARSGARLVVAQIVASDAEIRRRLSARQARTGDAYDVSDAGVEVYTLMRARAEPPADPHIIINTDGDCSAGVDALADLIRQS